MPHITPRKWGSATREHKLPRIKGGTDAMHNIGASHHECNFSRADLVTLKRVRPEKGSGQKQGKTWRAQLLTISPGGLWWTQRKIGPTTNSAGVGE